MKELYCMSLARYNDKILPASSRPAPKLAAGLKSVSLFLEVNNKQLSESSKKVWNMRFHGIILLRSASKLI